MLLGPRNLLEVRLSEGGIKKPFLERLAGPLRKRLVQFGVVTHRNRVAVARTAGTPGANAILT